MTWAPIACAAVAVIAVSGVLAYLLWATGETTQLLEYRCESCGDSFLVKNVKLEGPGFILCDPCTSTLAASPGTNKGRG